jgi:hypothetical protein
VPGLDCESVEFSLVHVGLTQISGPNEPLGLQYLSCNLFRGPRTCPAGLLFMLGPHWWLARAVFTRLPGYLGLLRPPSRRDRYFQRLMKYSRCARTSAPQRRQPVALPGVQAL